LVQKSQVNITNMDILSSIDLTTIDPTAVCNDGSPAIYYWKKSDAQK